MGLDSYALRMPQKIYGGKDSLDKLGEILVNFKKAAVFTDMGVCKAGLIQKPVAIIRECGVTYEIIGDIPAEPQIDAAMEIIDRFRKMNADLIIAVGGGSVMDVAKLASVAASEEYSLRDLLNDFSIAKKSVKTVMVPTTAGTGSEATPNAIVTLPEQELKVGIVNEEMTADYVILDASNLAKLPRPIAAATGVDALAHAIECFISRKANLYSDIFAMEAMRLIFANMEKACDDPHAADAKNNMLTASFYAGIAIAASGTTAVHALAYPLGGKYGVAHGVSNAMLLAPVMRFNEDACRARLCRVYDVVGEDGAAKTNEEKSAWVIKRIYSMVEHLEIPKNLKDYGITGDDLDVLVDSAARVTRLLNNNPKDVSREDIRKIYQELI